MREDWGTNYDFEDKMELLQLNRKKRIGKRYYSWCFTINNYTRLDMAQIIILSEACTYIICGFEVGDKGTPHIQGYCYLTHAKTRKSMSKWLCRARLQKADGTPSEAAYYCKDPEKAALHGLPLDVYEVGECPVQGKVTNRDKLENIMANPLDNFHLYNQYNKSYTALRSLQVDRNKDRLMYICPKSELIEFMRFKEVKSPIFDINTYFYGCDLIVFNGPYIMYQDEMNIEFNVEMWKNGFPQTKRYGYQTLYVDPPMICLVYRNQQEWRSLIKIYSDYIDGFKTFNAFPTPRKTPQDQEETYSDIEICCENGASDEDAI